MNGIVKCLVVANTKSIDNQPKLTYTQINKIIKIMKTLMHIFLAPALPVAYLCWMIVVGSKYSEFKGRAHSEDLVDEITNEVNQMYPMWSRIVTSILFYTALIYVL